ncbi:hypothetical protein [Angustibacter peucedani]
MSTAAGLLRALVDDAAVFPPGNAPLPQAVAEHREHRAAPYAPCVGPLLLRSTDAAAAAALLSPGERLRVALVVRPGSDPSSLPTAVEQLGRDERAEVVGLELPVSDPITLRPVVEVGVPVWLEVRREHLDDDLDAVLAAGCRAKLRTGGLSPDDVPADDVLARFLVGARERALRVKLTAGLHHALRTEVDVPGEGVMLQHGLAGVLLATSLATSVATSGGSPEAVAAMLAERDADVLRRGLRALDAGQVDALRATFVSFGCCGVTDPITELEALLDDPHPRDQHQEATP